MKASAPVLSCFDHLSSFKEIRHFISGREGGVSTGELGGLNLSFRVGDNEENVRANRAGIAEAIGISPGNLVFPAQTHSTNIAEVTFDNYTDFFSDTDGLITNVPGICIGVMSADCVPLLIFDPSSRSVAAIHAGWRGTVAGIVPKAIEMMKLRYNADPLKMVAGIGPSICGDVYEVGEEVAGEFSKIFQALDGIVRPKENGKFLLDLWEANKRMLVMSGLEEQNIELSGVCTYMSADRFFSARRSGNKAGRFGAGIMLV
jgi:polyphenol oxidase